nr:sulfotransferase 1B1-like [Pocillopora verrucosa]
MTSSEVTEVREGDWTTGNLREILGLKIPAYFTSDPQLLSDFITNLRTRPDDVFIASYPKSGTNWLAEIVSQIYNEGNLSEKRGFLLERALHSHQPNSPTPDLSALPSPRIFKTHLPYNVIPKSPNKDMVCKYIYVARNPKDVVVSYYFFWSGISSSWHGPWEFFAKLFVEGNVPWNHWNDHVLDWWKHNDDANILFVKYEDLKKDLLSHVRSIADFLNRPLTDDIISRIAEQSSFSAMKKDRDSVLTVPFRDGRNVPILRKGVVGDWKNYFTPELNERFEKEVLAKLQGSGLEFDFEI